jgi:3-hydroxybutyryl-CoA dehydratase
MKYPGFYVEDLRVGATETSSRVVTESDIAKFAEVSGDHNPLHMDEEFARQTRFGSRIAHGMLTASFVSAMLANHLPGPGCIYVSQSLRFKAPVRIDDTVTVRVTITNVRAGRELVTLKTEAFVGETLVLDGEALAHVPSREGLETE